MWSIMNSMKLRRKTSKRGEGDINISNRKASAASVSKDQSNPNLTSNNGSSASSPPINSGNKVERKESTRLGSGATKFLRSLRTGHLGLSGNKEALAEQQNSIALKELKISLDKEENSSSDHRLQRPPERSQSFQEKRLGVVATAITSVKTRTFEQSFLPTGNAEPVKVKHSRAQSFLCTTSQPIINGASLQRDPNIVALNPNNNVSFCPDPKVHHPYPVLPIVNCRNNPYETIYENLEIIRQQQQQKVKHHHRSKGKSSSSSSLKNLSVVEASSSSSSSSISRRTPSASFSSTGNIMTIFEKEKERRIPSTRKLSKETCCYEINYSDYMNIENQSSNKSEKEGSIKSLQFQASSAKEKPGKDKSRDAHQSNGSVNGKLENTSNTEKSHYSSPTPSSSTSTSTITTPTLNMMKSNGGSGSPGSISSNRSSTQENCSRKLRRSISEVQQPGDSISLSKFQTKVIDTSKTIYSSVSNGLSIWSFQKTGRCNIRSSGDSGSGKDSPYPIYGTNLSAPNSYDKCGIGLRPQQPIVASATLPRPSSNYQTLVKSSPSLRKDLETPPRANQLNRTNSNIILTKSGSALFSATTRSTPNLKEEHLQLYGQLPRNGYNLNKTNCTSQQILHQRITNNHYQQLPAATRSASAKLYQHQSRNRVDNRNRQVSTPPFEANQKLTQFTSNSNPSYLETPNEHLYENSSSGRKNSSEPAVPKVEQNCHSSNSSSTTMSTTNGGSSWLRQQQQEPATHLVNGSHSSISSTSPKSSNGPPVRDTASIKQVRYGPGHEKYPSWPVSATSAPAIDPAGELTTKMLPHPGSSRSKSWTESTDYPKEKVPSYARPYMKRMNHQSYTQQLKTVMEKSERNGPASESRQLNGFSSGNGNSLPIVQPPMGYRDLYNVSGYNHQNMSKGDPEDGNNEYNIPSPPERDNNNGSVGKSLTEEDLELYAKKYEERMSHYAQSEGYHSYISSECSSYISSGTPFLDQLRRESESNEEFWCEDSCDPNDPLFGISHLATTSGRESVTTVVTNSSGSSGTETLKWQGSNGDLTCNNSINNNSNSGSSNSSSTGSCSGGSRVWEKNITHSAKVPTPRKIHPDSVLVHHNGIRHIKNKLEANSASSHTKAETNLKKFPLSTYTRPSTLSLNSEKQPTTVPSSDKMCNKLISPLLTPSHNETNQISPIIDTSKPLSVAERILELEQQAQSSTSLKSNSLHHHHHPSSNMTTSSPATLKESTCNDNNNVSSSANSSNNFTDKFVKSSSLANLRESSCKAQPQHPSSPSANSNSSHHSMQRDSGREEANTPTTTSPSSLGYHNLWGPSSDSNLFRSLDHHSSNSNSPPTPVSYTYLDTEKKHKVADLTLKAIQKKALLAYYERHTGKSSITSPTENNFTNQSLCFSPTNEYTSKSSHNMSATEIVEKDLSFPSSTRLTLSLPRDIDRIKGNNHNSAEDLSQSSSSSHPISVETRSSGGISGNNHSLSTSSQSTSSAMTSSEQLSSPTNGQSTLANSIQQDLTNNNNSHKGDSGRASNHRQVNSLSQPQQPSLSQHEETHGESARMAYMSKYLPHLTRDMDATTSSITASNWNGIAAKSSDGATCVSHENEVVPIPPERPPKKPHLRNVPQQNTDEGKESSKPPPPLPRAPMRPPHHGNNKSSSNSNLGLPPPLPSKPQPHLSLPHMSPSVASNISVKRCSTPDLPLPPPPVNDEDQVAVINDDDPFPPPPTQNEVNTLMGPRSKSVSSGLSGYLHKDSYLAQRKERTLGYEGRYRRTLSPSGLGTNSGETTEQPAMMSTATSTEKIDSALSPSAWEKYHNIGAPSTTVIFSSHEIAKSQTPMMMASQQPSSLFHRSISCDSNLFNNKTGFSQQSHAQSAINPPPVAQVAPLRGIPSSEMKRTDPTDRYHYPTSTTNNNMSCYNESYKSFTLSTVRDMTHQQQQPDLSRSLKQRSSSLNQNDHHLQHNHHHHHHHGSTDEVQVFTKVATNNGTGATTKNIASGGPTKKSMSCMTDVQCQITPVNLINSPPTIKSEGLQSVMVVVSPLRFESPEKNHESNKICSPHHLGDNNKENILFVTNNNDTSSLKSEVSFRVNCTSDASSQTESGNEDDKDYEGDSALPTEPNSLSLTLSSTSSSSVSSSCNDMTTATTTNFSNGPSSLINSPSPTTSLSSYKGRQKSQEELECEELSRDFAKQLPHGDKLQTLLVPLPESKTSADYMEGLFHIELRMRSDQIESQFCSRNSSPEASKNERCSISPELRETCSTSSLSHVDDLKTTANNKHYEEAAHKRCNGGHAPLPADSPYFTISECKAKFLTQYVKDMHNESFSSTDSQELIKQKEELVSRISRKLEILRIEQSEIREEIHSNEQLGQIVIERVKETAKRNEFDKFKLHVEEIEKITSLLLGLSGRLARAENALMSLIECPNPQDKKILESKRDKLKEQLDEAKILKENIDRRSAQVSGFLEKYLSIEEYADYHHFTKMKAKLIIDAREIDEKIKLGDEQMNALQDTLSFTSSSSSSASNTN